MVFGCLFCVLSLMPMNSHQLTCVFVLCCWTWQHGLIKLLDSFVSLHGKMLNAPSFSVCQINTCKCVVHELPCSTIDSNCSFLQLVGCFSVLQWLYCVDNGVFCVCWFVLILQVASLATSASHRNLWFVLIYKVINSNFTSFFNYVVYWRVNL